MTLKQYKQKRDFKLTSEPTTATHKYKNKKLLFVVQKHDASHLHYDLRLEMVGVLKSWAVPKGPSLDPKIKRLAVQVEDHPLSYATFEGNIPEGQYGGGEVIVWDSGTWHCVGNPEKSLKAGKIKFILNGKKLQGGWTLVRTTLVAGNNKANWLLIKEADEFANDETDILEMRPKSVITHHSLKRDKQSLRNPGPAVKKKYPSPKLLSWSEPELARLVHKMPPGSAWLYELKFDGYRIISEIKAGKAKLFTRHHLDWTTKFKTIENALQQLPVDTAILDGEVVVLDNKGAPHFQSLQKALKTNSNKNMYYYIFDLLQLNDLDVAKLPLIERKKLLKNLLRQSDLNPSIRYSDHIENKREGALLYKKICQESLEGILIKNKEMPYFFGRNDYWLKLKCSNRQEFVIGGFTEPDGNRHGFGALLLGYYDLEQKLHYVGKVGSGFDSSLLREMTKIFKKNIKINSPFINPPNNSDNSHITWLKPVLVAEVDFRSWTRDDKVRQAIFIGLRKDKFAKEVTREKAMLIRPSKAKKSIPTTEVANVKISNPNKIFFPSIQLTKLGMAKYYYTIAKRMLPHIKNRPLNILRCPDGIAGECFRQKHLTHQLPLSIEKTSFKHKDKKIDGFIIRNIQGLINLVQLGAVEFHIWGELYSRQGFPDQIVFDLDPDTRITWPQLVDAAFLLKKTLLNLKLKSFVKTTGGKGLHITVPIKPIYTWSQIHTFAKAVANTLVKLNPSLFIATMSKDKRKNKIFIDYMRNSEGATFIAPYSIRINSSASVALPLSWAQLKKTTSSDEFTVENIADFLARSKKQPWENFFRLRQKFTKEIINLIR